MSHGIGVFFDSVRLWHTWRWQQ